MRTNLRLMTFIVSIIPERNKCGPIFVLKIWQFKNEYLRPNNWWRGTFRRVSNRWWMRILSQSSLHRKWSGSLFTNADKTTPLHFVVFYLCSPRKRRINFRYSILLPLTRSLSSGTSFRSFRSFSGTAARRALQAIFVVDMRCFAYPTYFFPLNLCTPLSLFSTKFHSFGNATSYSCYLPPTAQRM